MPNIPKVANGTPAEKSPAFSASWLNAVSDMLKWFLRAKASGEITSGSSPLEDSSGRVRIKNLTTEDLLRGHYVQLGDYLLDDIDHRKHWFDGNLYDAAEDGRIAILEKAVKSADTSMVRARIIGKCTARVNVTDIGHRFAAPDDGEYVLKSAASGEVEILSCNKITETGEQEVTVLLGGGGVEKFRLIRGQSYGIQSGSTIYFDNVVALADGNDPSNGDPDTLIAVANLFGQTYSDNELINAVHYQGLPEDRWETLKAATGTDRYRLIQGRVVSSVTPEMTSFEIDGVVVLAGGLDPSGGNPSATITIVNAQQEAFAADETIVVVWYDSGIDSGWSTLVVERNRMISATVYTASSPLHVKNVQPVCSGLDPRTDPTNSEELVDVYDYLESDWKEGDILYAVWNVQTLEWEALPKGASLGGFTANITTQISAGSAAVPISGSGTVYSVAGDGTATSLGTKVLYNPYALPAKGSCTVIKLSEGSFLIAAPCTTVKTIQSIKECNLFVDTDTGLLTLQLTYDSYQLFAVETETDQVMECAIGVEPCP